MSLSFSIFLFSNSFKWPEDAGVALPCYNVTEPAPPLMLNQKSSLFKLFMNDTGLLSALGMKGLRLDLLRGRLDVNMGKLSYMPWMFIKPKEIESYRHTIDLSALK